MDLSDTTIAVTGLGYVGLPLAIEFGIVQPFVGLDILARCRSPNMPASIICRNFMRSSNALPN